MTVSAANPRAVDFRALVDAIAPRRWNFEVFGLAAGWRGYRVYTALAAKSDAELAAMGLSRADLPRAAAEAMKL